MKKSGLLTLLALAIALLLAFGCRKEENVNTDTAITDTGVNSTATVGSTATVSTSTASGQTTPVTGRVAPSGSTAPTGTTGTEKP